MFNFHSIVFPKPNPLYDENSFKGYENMELIYVQAVNDEETLKSLINPTKYLDQQLRQIPCLYMKLDQDYIKRKKHILYFHGNAEDIGNLPPFLSQLQENLRMNIIAMEYAGYGIYSNYRTSEQLICKDAQYVYNYIINQLKIPENDIIIFGRSIGSGASCYLAAYNNPKLLILMSPFTSVRQVAKQFVTFFAYILKDKFQNIKLAPEIKCPALIIHGKNDLLINHEQAKRLYRRLNDQIQTFFLFSLGSYKKSYHFPDNMSHSEFDMNKDIIEPIFSFFECIDQADQFEKCFLQTKISLTQVDEENSEISFIQEESKQI